MDPVTAIGLAGTIATFIDYSIKLQKCPAEVQSQGACAQILEAEAFAQQTLLSLQHLKALTTRGIEPDPTILSRECTLAAENLLQVLHPLKCKGKSKWMRLKKAFRSMLSQRHVNSLTTRLTALQEQIQLYVKAFFPMTHVITV